VRVKLGLRERKEAVIGELKEEYGEEIKPRTITVVVNPDTKTADIYEFDDFHDILRWDRDGQAALCYVRELRARRRGR
jgi:hypothetical protein